MNRLKTWAIIISLIVNVIFIFLYFDRDGDFTEIVAKNELLEIEKAGMEIEVAKIDAEYKEELLSVTLARDNYKKKIEEYKFDNASLTTDINRLTDIEKSETTWKVKYERLRDEFLIGLQKINVQQKIIEEQTKFINLTNKALEVKDRLILSLKKTNEKCLKSLGISVQNTKDCVKKKTSRIAIGPTVLATYRDGNIDVAYGVGITWDVRGLWKRLFMRRK